MRTFPPILDVFNHDAMPHWRTRAFWWSTDARVAWPSLIVGLVVFLYLALAAEFIGLGLVAAAPAGSWVHGVGAWLAEDFAEPHQFVFDAVTYALCIIMGENIARVTLDISATDAFKNENAARLARATAAGFALIMLMLAVRIAEKQFGAPSFQLAQAGVFAAMISTASFASLAGAFRQGVRMKEEQDLTVQYDYLGEIGSRLARPRHVSDRIVRARWRDDSEPFDPEDGQGEGDPVLNP